MEVTAKANDSKAVGLGAYGTGSLIDITGDTVISSEVSAGRVQVFKDGLAAGLIWMVP